MFVILRWSLVVLLFLTLNCLCQIFPQQVLYLNGKKKKGIKGQARSSATASTKSTALRKRKKPVGISLDCENVPRALRRTRPLGQTIDLSVEDVTQPCLEK